MLGKPLIARISPIAAWVLLAATAAPAAAAVQRITVHVEGLACPFCTYNLEKRIRTLEGVPENPNWRASVEKGTASFDWKPDVPFDAEAVREQVRKAGFTPGKIETKSAAVADPQPAPPQRQQPQRQAEAPETAAGLDPKVIERAAGAAAAVSDDGVIRIGWSRDDVPVRVDGMDFPPSAGLGSWAAFKDDGEGSAIVMGDTVVFPDEVDAAMDAAFAHGLGVTALHNHFFFDEPRVFFMHIGGHGRPEDLARGVKATWDAIRGVRAERPQPADRFPGSTPSPGGELDAGRIERITGLEASTRPGGVVRISAGREGIAHGVAVGGSMGLGTWAAFTGGDELASIDGDFIMTAGEVQPVLRALRRHGIHIVALHNHMTGEAPAYYFVHFWAKGPAEKLAEGFRAALDAQADATKPANHPDTD